MKIFISWSGEHAKQVATVFRGWLKDVFDSADPWMSDIDIAGGTYSLPAIAEALAGAKFGIVITTKGNQATPWINFEAGALSKVVDAAEVRVMPMLVDLRVLDLTSPLKQFQAAPIDAGGVGKLIKSIGDVLGLEPVQIERKTQTFWPQLDAALEGLAPVESDTYEDDAGAATRSEADVLDEILIHIRAMRQESLRPSAVYETSTAFRTRDASRPAEAIWAVVREAASTEGITVLDTVARGGLGNDGSSELQVVVDGDTVDKVSVRRFQRRVGAVLGLQPTVLRRAPNGQLMGLREFFAEQELGRDPEGSDEHEEGGSGT